MSRLKIEALVHTLKHSSFAGRESVVWLLADNGADLEAVDVNGDTPIHHAVLGGIFLQMHNEYYSFQTIFYSILNRR